MKLRGVGLAAILALTGCGGEAEDPALVKTEGATGVPAPSGAPAASATATVTASVTAEPEIPAPDAPVVDLGGVANLPGHVPPGRPSLGAVDWLVRVYVRPDAESKVLGFLRGGAVVEAKSGQTKGETKGCRDGWQAIEPTGWVCMSEMTRSLDDPVLRAAHRPPDFAHKLPYMYGTVTRGGPVYARIPTDDHLAEFEPHLKKHLEEWRDDKESGAVYGLDVWLRYTGDREVPSALDALKKKVTDSDIIPPFLRDGQVAPNLSGLIKGQVKVDQVDRRQGRSFIASFLHQGRRYNVTPDLVVIPADRFRPIRGSDFHGWQPEVEGLEFPFAVMRRTGKKWLWDGKRMKNGGTQPWREALQLTGKRQIYKKRLYYETKEGFYVDDRHASEVTPAKRWPKWAKQGGKWIDINLTQQLLKAYEGKKMVYVTIISSGEAGLADPDGTTATIRGIYRIHTKFVTTTMDSEEVGEAFELRDVPYVQYFKDGYALHGAYWHDGFGRPKSHGCINLAPEDARRLFFWTDPQVPARWHGSRKSLTGTHVFVHE